MKKNFLIPFVSILLTGLLLLGLSAGLNGIAAKNAHEEHLSIMKTLLHGSETFVVEEYTGDDENIVSVHKAENGYVIETTTPGYAKDITMLVAVTNEGNVVGLVVREMHETPSLGLNALNDEVGTNVDAITGATVTSKAIARCINSAVAYVTGADIDSGATSWGG